MVELREVWPEAVDDLASAVWAGLSLPEALTLLGARGPEQLRSAFRVVTLALHSRGVSTVQVQQKVTYT